MRHLIQFVNLLTQVAKIIGFILFKVFVERAELAASNANRPTIDLRHKLTIQETAIVPLETAPETETVGELPAISINQIKPQIDTHKICIHNLTPQLELVKPQVHDLTPALQIPASAINPLAIADLDRAAQVDKTLQQAWNQGITTYKELMAYVKQHTGKGCSRRVISEWKKSRSVTEVA